MLMTSPALAAAMQVSIEPQPGYDSAFRALRSRMNWRWLERRLCVDGLRGARVGDLALYSRQAWLASATADARFRI